MNHRPPAIPRISRFAVRQRRTFLPDLSSGRAGANPDVIFGGGWTGNGFVGGGYCGIGTPSRLVSSSNGAPAADGWAWGDCGLEFSGSGSGEWASNGAVTGEDAAVPVFPVRRVGQYTCIRYRQYTPSLSTPASSIRRGGIAVFCLPRKLSMT